MQRGGSPGNITGLLVKSEMTKKEKGKITAIQYK